jgi:hypothetical protein
MSDLAPFAAALVTVVAVVTLLTFALGTQRNIAKGNEALRWLQSGLPMIGRRTTLRWLGSSAVELKLARSAPPLRAAEVVVVLEPRDLTWWRALGRMKGRRDFLILRGQLTQAPRFEVEAGDSRGWTGRDRLRRLDPGAWERTGWSGPDIDVAHTPGVDPALLRSHWERLHAASGGIWRLSVRREHPHVEVHVLLPDTTGRSADELFRAFRDLAETASSKA